MTFSKKYLISQLFLKEGREKSTKEFKKKKTEKIFSPWLVIINIASSASGDCISRIDANNTFILLLY